MKPRHGAVSTTLLAVAGVLGLGAAVASLTTGVTPCSLISSCGTDADAPTAVTVADAEAASSCGGVKAEATTVAATSDCSEKTACEGETRAMTVADSGDCAEKAACDGDVKASTVAASKGDCGEKTACEGEAQAMTVAASGDCGGESACEGDAKVVAASNTSDCATACDQGATATTVAASGDCGDKPGDCTDGNPVAVAASASDCGSGAGCDGEAKPAAAMTVAAEGEACGGECAEGDAKSLPVAAHAFNAECPYSGNPAKADVVSAHYGMDVHFCCAGCKSRFEKAEVETRAQLVAGVVQPINDTCCDKPVDTATTAVVQGFPVAFCKPACGEMVRNASEQKQMNFVASKLEYVNDECCGKPTADAKLVGFHKGQAVAFNGSGCAEKFNAMSDREKDAYVKKVSAGETESCGDKKCADEGCQNAA